MPGRAEADLTELAVVFRGLSDQTRIRIMNLLSESDFCVCDMVQALGLPQSLVSRHLAYLRKRGLVDVTRVGRWAHYRLAEPADPVHHAIVGIFRNELGGLANMAEERAVAVRHRDARVTPC